MDNYENARGSGVDSDRDSGCSGSVHHRIGMVHVGVIHTGDILRTGKRS